jgi:hypothetical protein
MRVFDYYSILIRERRGNKVRRARLTKGRGVKNGVREENKLQQT